MGAPSIGAGTAGAATAEYANNRPTIRINILIVRFIGSLLVRVPWEREPSLGRNYTEL